MDAQFTPLELKVVAAKTAAVPALMAIGKALHGEIDKLVALHGEAEIPAPWLELARAKASDLIGNLGSHLTGEAVPKAS